MRMKAIVSLACMMIVGAASAQEPESSRESAGLRRNAHFLRAPGPGQSWEQWLALMGEYRQTIRDRLSETREPFDDAIYGREDLEWMTRNFVCGFLFIYDRSFWNPERREYEVEGLCDHAAREFGGYDSVVLWQAYPRIGADERNQFDFFRDMPGGLAGGRDVSRRFHAQGIKVFIPYNPWDTGTRREEVSDELALANLVSAIEADGIFLDTMVAAPTGLRQAVDAVRPGVAFEPELHPAIAEMQICSGSWAQWFQAWPEVGVLHLKWLEPRHMQHQIRRWDLSHQAELAAAWLNGSGILVWENVFGSWNPWNAADRASLRRMMPVLRHYADLFIDGRWLPYYPAQLEGVYASCWESPDARLWTVVNLTDRKLNDVVLEIDPRDQLFFDLWNGRRLEAESVGGKARVKLELARFGAVAAVSADRQDDAFAQLLRHQQREAERPIAVADDDPHLAAASVVEPKSPPQFPAAVPASATDMLRCAPVSKQFKVRHMRRECGCYPDPAIAEDRWPEFLTGTPHDRAIEHRVDVTLPAYSIDPRPVTNGEFEAFLKATGYSPACRDKFLHHWAGTTCPAAIRDEPVVYVDLADARAYAAWVRKRLPTEWEWQHAAETHQGALAHEQVFEWTESERDDGHTRFVLLRGGCRHQAKGSIWYFPGGPQPVDSHAKFILLDSGLDRCSTIGFRCVSLASE